MRVALIGYGLAGEFFHAPLIAATPGMRIGAIVTGNTERAHSAAQSFPAASVLPNADSLWARAGDFDLVVIATPNRTHVPLAEQALRAGLPVVVDKPLAPTAAEGRQLIQQAASSGLMLTVFQNRRWDGDFLTLKRLVDEGRLGAVRRYESRFERWRPVPKVGWRLDADPAAAGGVLYDLGAHLIDQALLLFGPVTRIYAELDARNAGVAVEDDAFVALTHASGVRSHLWMSTVAAQPGPRFRALGSLAVFTKHGLDPQESALRSGMRPGESGWGEEDREQWGVLGAGDELELVRTEAGSYQEFYHGVLRSLRGGAPPPVDPAESAAVVEVIEAARRAG